MKLNKSLISDLEVDIRQGLSDSELQKKHDISRSAWYCWKRRGKKDQQKGLTTIYVMLLDILREGRVKVLDESLINKLEADKGYYDFNLREKYGISKRTWYEWKHKGVIDRQNGLKTLHTMLLDRLEGQEVVKQIEDIVVEMALSKGMSVSTTTTTYKNKSGKITEREITKFAKLPDNSALKAALFWLSHRDPANWSDQDKKPEIVSIATIIPDSGRLTEDEWLAKYGPKQQEQKAKTDDKPDDK